MPREMKWHADLCPQAGPVADRVKPCTCGFDLQEQKRRPERS